MLWFVLVIFVKKSEHDDVCGNLLFYFSRFSGIRKTNLFCFLISFHEIFFFSFKIKCWQFSESEICLEFQSVLFSSMHLRWNDQKLKCSKQSGFNYALICDKQRICMRCGLLQATHTYTLTLFYMNALL